MHRLADERTRPGLDVADRQRQDTGTAKLDDQDAHAANSHIAVSSGMSSAISDTFCGHRRLPLTDKVRLPIDDFLLVFYSGSDRTLGPGKLQVQDPNAGNSRVAISSAEVCRCWRQ